MSRCNFGLELIKHKMKEALTGKKGDSIFTAINNGEIKNEYETPERYLNTIDEINEDDYHGNLTSSQLLLHFLSIPGVINENGLSILLFRKTIKIVHQILEKERIRENYQIVCQNEEESNYVFDPKRVAVLMLKEGLNYYPIIKLSKNEKERDVSLEKTFRYSESKDNIIDHIKPFYNLNCNVSKKYLLFAEKENLIAKRLVELLNKTNYNVVVPPSLSKTSWHNAKSQIIDGQNKCRYIVVQNGLLIPTSPSGAIYNLPIVDLKNNLKSMDEMIKLIDDFNSNADLKLTIDGVHFDSQEGDKIRVIGLILDDQTSIPLLPTVVNSKDVPYYKQPRTVDETIDALLEKNAINKPDIRETVVKEATYNSEIYQLFRLEIANYLNNNPSDKTTLTNLLSKDNSRTDKENKIKKFFYHICSDKLYTIFNKLLKRAKINEQDGGASNLIFVYPDSKKIDYLKYDRKNQRKIAESLSKDECDSTMYHLATNCHLAMKPDILAESINKITEELLQNDVKAMEILENRVSKIVERTIFTERNDEILLKSMNKEASNILANIFDTDALPVIGRKRRHGVSIDLEELSAKHPIREIKYWYVQQIIDNNITIYRAVANSIYWIADIKKAALAEAKLSTLGRNLGYYSTIQSDLANLYKAKVIDWLLIEKNQESIASMIKKYENITVDQFIHRVSTEITSPSEYIVELHILSIVLQRNINIFNENYQLIYHFNNGLKSKEDAKGIKTAINIQYSYLSKNLYPDSIVVIYPK